MKKMHTLIKALVCGYIIFCLIAGFGEIKAEILSALKMWAGVLIPSLFPYLVLSQYITSSGVLSIFAPLEKIISHIFNISRAGAGVYVCSLVCGYPSGAICTGDLYKNGVIKKDEAERLVCFTNNAGPLFLISAVGSCMLGCTRDGVAIYVIQNISAATAAILLGMKSKKISKNSRTVQSESKSLAECCSSAVTAMLSIGGYIVLSACIARIALIGIRGTAANTELAECIVYFVLEISGAMKSLAALGNSSLIFALMCAAASWAGISVIMQISSVLPKDFSVKKIVCARGCEAVASFILGYIYKSRTAYCSGCQGNDEWVYISLGASAVIFALSVILCTVKKKSYRT